MFAVLSALFFLNRRVKDCPFLHNSWFINAELCNRKLNLFNQCLLHFFFYMDKIYSRLDLNFFVFTIQDFFLLVNNITFQVIHKNIE